MQDLLLAKRIEGVIRLLGYDTSGGLVRSWQELAGSTNRHVIRQAFTTINVSAIFGFAAVGPDGRKSFTPIVYLAAADDAEAAKGIHRLAWSQGVVPLLLVATPSSLEVRRSLAPPPERPISVAWSRLEDESLPIELTSLTGVALRSSVVWRDFVIDRSSRVDKALLEGIVQLSETVERQEEVRLDRSVVHAVIGRFLYLYVLLDRRVIDAKWIGSLTGRSGRALCPTIADTLKTPDGAYVVWPAREVWALFDHIDSIMNGAIFPVAKAERAKVSEQTLHLIHRVIRHGDRVGPTGRQLSFLNVSFATLRTETISAIYELFLSLESEDEQSDDGAFYTPPFLVDYVLDETDRVRPFDRSSRILDPAAGSGIFLVGAFRRMLERAMPAGPWTASHFRAARKLLEQSIFGIERNPQAANVCRFSLYLTLLDYMSGSNIAALGRMTKGERVFPPLVGNILSVDVFAVPSKGAKSIGHFTHVVGNPPWGSFGDSATRTNEQRSQQRQDKITRSMTPAIAFHASLDATYYPVSNKRLSELFIWKVKQDFLASGGALGILISTRSLVSRSATAFPNAMAQQFQLKGVANLSHFRYRLFAEARSPTVAIFARNDEPDLMDQVWVYAPLLSSQPIGETGHLWSIIVNSVEVEAHRLRDLTRSPEGWFDHLILRPLDRRYARHLRAWNERSSNSLGGFLEASGLRMLRGGSPQQTGLPDNLLLKATTFRQLLGLDGLGFASYPHDQLRRHKLTGPYERLFGGNILLIPRSMNDVIFVREPVGFSSTFNAIYFVEPGQRKQDEALLMAMAAYLTSDVAHYFYALIGRSWILDHARLEKNDLLAVPFPLYRQDPQAFETLMSGDQDEITALVAERVGLDGSFVGAVKEYTTFRSGYEDSQLPPSSLQSPAAAEIRCYRGMLVEQLQQSFGSRSEAEVSLEENAGGGLFAQLVIHVRPHGDKQASSTDETRGSTEILTGQFNPYSTISYDPRTNVVAIVKPWTHVAWTIEQAFADARGVSAAILRSGAPA